MLKVKIREEKAQALVEFLMVMPLLLTFVWYLVHVNLAINKSIVGQVNARSQLFLKLFNHRGGPMAGEFNLTKRAAYYIGVADDIVQEAPASYKAPVETLGVGAFPAKMAIGNDDKGEAKAGTYRQNIRVRTVFGICTERKSLGQGQGLTAFCGTENPN